MENRCLVVPMWLRNAQGTVDPARDSADCNDTWNVVGDSLGAYAVRSVGTMGVTSRCRSDAAVPMNPLEQAGGGRF